MKSVKRARESSFLRDEFEKRKGTGSKSVVLSGRRESSYQGYRGNAGGGVG